MGTNEIGPFQHDLLLFQRLLLAPDTAFKSGAGGGNSSVDIGGIAACELSAGLAIHRPDAGEGFSRCGGSVDAADEMTALRLEAGENAFPIVARIVLGHFKFLSAAP